MPAPTQPRPAPPQLPTKRRRIDHIRFPNPPLAPPSAPNPPLIRRRAPALERLPTWLSVLRRDFIAAGPSFPLPARIADSGNPFYDWDAWALNLLEPTFWRRRGPWHRLIACCTATRPPTVQIEQVADIKAALVRIVIAEVVTKLVSREGAALTPEDRNWITSVASRQRGRHARKPTLMLLFDVAFAVFDFANFCNSTFTLKHDDAEEPAHVVELLDKKLPERPWPDRHESIERAVDRLVSETLCLRPRDRKPSELLIAPTVKTLPTVSVLPACTTAPLGAHRLSVENVVLRVLDIIHDKREGASETWRIDNVNQVIQVIETYLTRSRAHRWFRKLETHADAAKEGIVQAAKVFSRRLALRAGLLNPQKGETHNLHTWLLQSLHGENWCVWADLANDCNYIMIRGSLPEHRVHELVCKNIADNLFSESETVSGSLREEQAASDSTGLTLRNVFDVAMAMERFFSFFLETYGIDNTPPKRIKSGVSCFEGVVELLAKLREPLINVPNWTEAMVDWSLRSLHISTYYREALFGDQEETTRRGEDIQRAIRIAFSEASWPAKLRSSRLVYQAPEGSTPTLKNKERRTTQAMAQIWVARVDLNDPLNLAAAIVPWDPCRALTLLDQAIGLTAQELEWVRSGRAHLPLWDYRRIAICRNLLKKHSVVLAKLTMERLQILFSQSKFHVGGNFSEHAVEILQSDVDSGNFCAQTTLGLLHAGPGQYWKLARTSAKCQRNLSVGIHRLFVSAVAGDLEACTAVAHILAECGDSEDIFKLVSAEQVYTLVRTAHATQNADAMMNAGVLFRYGLPGLAASDMVAHDAFLVALQGGHSAETKSIAARHLLETAGPEELILLQSLSQLISDGHQSSSSS